jgi:nicotinamidase-related amidase
LPFVPVSPHRAGNREEPTMLTIDRERSALLIIDFQQRLMPAIEDGAAAVANARRLLQAAEMLHVPILFTEHNAGGLGPTVAELADFADGCLAHKVTFDACRMAGFLDRLEDRRDIVVAGCETHVCVMQTALGLLDAGRRVWLVRDAVGSRRSESKESAVSRLAKHGAEIVTTEMVVFEWLGSAEHPRFRDIIALIK